MKSTVLVLNFAAVILVSVNAQGIEEMKKLISDCKDKYSCTDNVPEILKNRGDLSEGCTCLFGCVAKVTDAMNENNGFSKDRLELVLEHIAVPKDKIEAVAEACSTESGTSECQAAKDFVACMKEQVNS